MQEILGATLERMPTVYGRRGHLAATVMMGGLLEALFVARANRLANKAPPIHSQDNPSRQKWEVATAQPVDASAIPRRRA